MRETAVETFSDTPAETPQEPVSEPETPEPAAEPEEEFPPPEAAPEPPVTPTAREQMRQQDELYESGQRYLQRLEKMAGWDATYHARCPLCPDLHVGVIDMRHAGHYPAEVVKVITHFLGLAT